MRDFTAGVGALCHHRAMSRSVGARFVCDDCGRDVSGVPPSMPCSCGGTSRRRVDATDAFQRPATPDSPRWDPLKDWTAKYLQLTWNVGQLRRLYAPDSGAQADEVRRIVDMTFASCVGLGDWLTSGPEPVTVTPGDVARLVAAEPLSICATLVNGSDINSARIVAVGFVRPPHYWLEYRRPNARPVRYDALDLADRCLLTWQTFLTARSVKLPTWQP
jgi:hypothetical protein